MINKFGVVIVWVWLPTLRRTKMICAGEVGGAAMADGVREGGGSGEG